MKRDVSLLFRPDRLPTMQILSATSRHNSCVRRLRDRRGALEDELDDDDDDDVVDRRPERGCRARVWLTRIDTSSSFMSMFVPKSITRPLSSSSISARHGRLFRFPYTRYEMRQSTESDFLMTHFHWNSWNYHCCYLMIFFPSLSNGAGVRTLPTSSISVYS